MPIAISKEVVDKVEKYILDSDDKHGVFVVVTGAIQEMVDKGIDIEDASQIISKVVGEMRNNYGD